MQFIGFLFSLIIAVALAVFAVFNQGSVSTTYSPLHDPVEVKFYLVALGFLGFGFLWGAFSVWINGGTGRKERRQLRKQVKMLQTEIDRFNSRPEHLTDPATMKNDLFPVIEKKEQNDS